MCTDEESQGVGVGVEQIQLKCRIEFSKYPRFRIYVEPKISVNRNRASSAPRDAAAVPNLADTLEM